MDNSSSKFSGRSDRARDCQDEVNDLQRRLDEATSKIMTLVRTAEQITDTEIGEQVEGLQDAIQWWVNGVEQDLKRHGRDFKDIFHRVMRDDDDARVFFQLRLCTSSRGTDTGWWEWLGELSTSIYIVLSRHIWVYLQYKIFDDPYPIGVSRRLANTFDDILRVMEGDDGSEGMNHHTDDKYATDWWLDQILLANKWRSDTMRALTKTPDYQRQRKNAETDLSDDLKMSLIKWIGDETIERHAARLQDNIVQPAIVLHRQMVCSSHEYVITESDTADAVRGKIPAESSLLAWTVKDIAKWRPAYGDIGGVFQTLYPSVHRKGLSGKENILAAKPVVLVYDKAASRTVPGATERWKSQPDLQKGQDAWDGSQRAPEVSPAGMSEGLSHSHTPETSPRVPATRSSVRPVNERPTHEEHTTKSHEHSVTRVPVLARRLFGIFDLSPLVDGNRRARADRTPERRASESTDDRGRPYPRSRMTDPTARIKRVEHGTRRSSKTDKPHKPTSARSRRSSATSPSSPIKTTPEPRPGDAMQTTAMEPRVPDDYDDHLAPHEELDEYLQPHREGWGHGESETGPMIVVNAEGVREIRYGPVETVRIGELVESQKVTSDDLREVAEQGGA